jgi:P pilus assembly chaperone PapD
VIGPGAARRNRPTVYRIQVRNAGTAAVTGARLVIAGRGVRINKAVGVVRPRQTKTVRVVARFRLKGLSRTRITLTTRNAGRKVARKNVRVR